MAHCRGRRSGRGDARTVAHAISVIFFFSCLFSFSVLIVLIDIILPCVLQCFECRHCPHA